MPTHTHTREPVLLNLWGRCIALLLTGLKSNCNHFYPCSTITWPQPGCYSKGEGFVVRGVATRPTRSWIQMCHLAVSLEDFAGFPHVCLGVFQFLALVQRYAGQMNWKLWTPHRNANMKVIVCLRPFYGLDTSSPGPKFINIKFSFTVYEATGKTPQILAGWS